MQKPRIFKSSPWNSYFARNVFAKQKNKLWHYLRSSIALKRLGNPPIPTGGPTHQTSGPSHHDEGKKRWKRMNKCPFLCTLWSFGDFADNGFIHLKWLPIFEYPKIWKIRIFQIFEKPFSNFEFGFEKFVKQYLDAYIFGGNCASHWYTKLNL